MGDFHAEPVHFVTYIRTNQDDCNNPDLVVRSGAVRCASAGAELLEPPASIAEDEPLRDTHWGRLIKALPRVVGRHGCQVSLTST